MSHTNTEIAKKKKKWNKWKQQNIKRPKNRNNNDNNDNNLSESHSNKAVELDKLLSNECRLDGVLSLIEFTQFEEFPV